MFTHVSTCYVNCDKEGFIKEDIYDINEDVETFMNRIQSMSLEEQDAKTLEILGRFPNTYTFTKSMAERAIKKRRPAGLPMLIVRPSIVGACYRDPMPGWTDTLSALGGLGFAAGLGILNYVNTKDERIFDLIPADFVSHNTIVGTAL